MFVCYHLKLQVNLQGEAIKALPKLSRFQNGATILYDFSAVIKRENLLQAEKVLCDIMIVSANDTSFRF